MGAISSANGVDDILKRAMVSLIFADRECLIFHAILAKYTYRALMKIGANVCRRTAPLCSSARKTLS